LVQSKRAKQFVIMDGYAFINFILERIEIAKFIKEVYGSLVRSKSVFDLPEELGEELVSKLTVILNEGGKLYEEGQLKEPIKTDLKKFLFSVRMPLVIVVRERYASRKCELWEMHELLREEDNYLGGLSGPEGEHS